MVSLPSQGVLDVSQEAFQMPLDGELILWCNQVGPHQEQSLWNLKGPLVHFEQAAQTFQMGYQ